MSVVLVIPDLQIPFEHPDSLPFILEVYDAMECDTVVNIGDEVDFYALSSYVKKPEAMSWTEEYSHSMERLHEWYKVFPQMKVCISNHTWRPYKKASDAGIPQQFLRSINDVLHAPAGWQWRDKWIIDGVQYEHGDAVPSNPDRVKNMRDKSVVLGHHHSRYSINYYRVGEQKKFVCYTGCLIEESSYAFTYNRNPNAQLGCVVVENGVPMLIPMLLDKNGRWTGSLTL